MNQQESNLNQGAGQYNMPNQSPNMNGYGGYQNQQGMNMNQNMGQGNQFNQAMQGMAGRAEQAAAQMGNYMRENSADLRWDYNRVGVAGLRLIAYVALANLMFMCGLTTALAILLVLVVVVEKDKNLIRIVASMLATVLLLSIAVDIWDLVESPLHMMFVKLESWAKYDSVPYHFAAMGAGLVSTVDTLVNWVYHIALLAIGAMNMDKIKKGTYKTLKYITKYF